MALKRLHPIHKGADRLVGGAPDGEHAAVMLGHDRADCSLRGLAGQPVKLDRPRLDVVVRIFLISDDEVGVLHHQGRQVTVQVKHGADHGVWSSDGPGMGKNVSLTVIIADGDHGTMHGEQHHVDRACSFQIVHDVAT